MQQGTSSKLNVYFVTFQLSLPITAENAHVSKSKMRNIL